MLNQSLISLLNYFFFLSNPVVNTAKTAVKRMDKLILLVVLTFHYVSAHQIYENECPAVTPMPDFDIEKVRVLTIFVLLCLCYGFVHNTWFFKNVIFSSVFRSMVPSSTRFWLWLSKRTRHTILWILRHYT